MGCMYTIMLDVLDLFFTCTADTVLEHAEKNPIFLARTGYFSCMDL